MLSALLQAGAGLASALFGSDSSSKTKEHTKSKTVSRSRTQGNLSRLVRDATKNGFNPLTVLRSGGLSAYSTTNNRSFTNTKSKGKGSSSSSAPVGAAIAQAGNLAAGVASDYEASQAQLTARDAWQGLRTVSDPISIARQREYDMVQAQLGGNNQPGAVTVDGGNPRIPQSNNYKANPALANPGGSWFADTTQTYGGKPGTWDGKTGTPNYGEPEFENYKVTNFYPKWTGLSPNPYFPDGETIETAGGDNEILSMLYGFGVKIPAEVYWQTYGAPNSAYNTMYGKPSARAILDQQKSGLSTENYIRSKVTPLEKPQPIAIPNLALPESWDIMPSADELLGSVVKDSTVVISPVPALGSGTGTLTNRSGGGW